MFDITKDLTQGKPFKTLFVYSLPIIGGNLFQLFYTLADTVIVGRTMGADALAAVGCTGTFTYFILCFIQGVMNGFGVCLGQLFGERDEQGMKKSIAASSILTFAFSAAIVLVVTPLSPLILRVMNTPEKIFDMANEYLVVIIAGSMVTAFYNLISNQLRAIGDSKTPLVFLVISSILNILLDYVFIVPLSMGVSGAAWATVFSQFVCAVCCTVYALKKYKIFRISRECARKSVSVMRRHIKIGLPMGIQMSVMCIGQIAVQFAVNGFGSEAVAGYTAAGKIEQIAVLINNAVGTASSNYVAQNYGALKPKRIKQGVRASVLQIIFYNALIFLFILLFSRQAVAVFVEKPSEEIIRYAVTYLLYILPFFVFMGTLIVYRSAIQSVNNPVVPFSACIVELVMRTVSALVLSSVIGYTGACIASPAAWIAANILLIPSYMIIMKRLFKTVTH